MKKNILTFVLTFLSICAINYEVLAGCAAGEVYVEILANDDTYFASDPTTFTVTIGGNVVYTGNPATDGSPIHAGYLPSVTSYIIVSGCFPEGAAFSVDYVDGFGDGTFISPPIFGIIGCDFVGNQFVVSDATGGSGTIVSGTLPSDNDGITPGANNPNPLPSPAPGSGCGGAGTTAGNYGQAFVSPTSADQATAINNFIADPNFFTNATFYPVCDVAGGAQTGNSLSGSQTQDLTEGFEICTEWVQPNVTGNETGAFVGFGTSTLELQGTDPVDSDGNGSTNDCGGGITNIEIFDAVSCATAIVSNTGLVTGLTPGNTYIACVTTVASDNNEDGPDNIAGTADDGTSPPAEGTCVYEGTYVNVYPFEAVCPVFNAISVAPLCIGYDVCIGYVDVDQDGFGDGGEDPTGIMMTVTDGIGGAAGTPTLLNDGIFSFDADGDDVNDAVGYCVTVLFPTPTACAPVPYTLTLDMTCADGSAGVISDLLTLSGAEETLTGYDYLGGVFGLPNSGAVYPPLAAFFTTAVCPDANGNGAEAAFVEVVLGELDLNTGTITPATDGNGDPIVCTTLSDTPPNACDAVGGDAAFLVQYNGITDPFLSAVVGAGSFACGFDGVVDLSYTCNNCQSVACDIGADVSSSVIYCFGDTPLDLTTDNGLDYSGFDAGPNATVNAGVALVEICGTYNPANDLIPGDPTSNTSFTGFLVGQAYTYFPGTAAGCDGEGTGCDFVTLVPVTYIDIDANTNNFILDADPANICVGTPFTLSFRPEIIVTGGPYDCNNGITLTISGGAPDDGTGCVNNDAGQAVPGEYALTGAFGGITIGGQISFFNLSDGTYNYTITDSDGCTTTSSVTVTGCNAVCSIDGVSVTNIQCSDNGTPSDTTDDTYTFDVTVTATNGDVTGFTFGGGLSGTGAYGATLPQGPFPISGGNISFTVADNTDPNCSGSGMAMAPAPCSNPTCDAEAGTICPEGVIPTNNQD